ncbi:MAG: hypothetical protein ABIS34_00285 [Opitutus sp.]
MKTNFEGPLSGPGTILDWSGNSRVGAGRMAITPEATPPALSYSSQRSSAADSRPPGEPASRHIIILDLSTRDPPPESKFTF